MLTELAFDWAPLPMMLIQKRNQKQLEHREQECSVLLEGFVVVEEVERFHLVLEMTEMNHWSLVLL